MSACDNGLACDIIVMPFDSLTFYLFSSRVVAPDDVFNHVTNLPSTGVFKRSAAKIEAFLTSQGSDVRVEINKEKPGRGNFVVRVEGKEEPVCELLGLKRPFKALRELDMDEVGQSVVDALGEDE